MRGRKPSAAVMFEVQRLPVRVRPLAFETAGSLAERLRAANRIPVEPWKYDITVFSRTRNLSCTDGLDLFIEQAGGLETGHFQREQGRLPRHRDGSACTRCCSGLEHRFGCVRCSRGVVVVQYNHDGPRVCARHRRWIGPPTRPVDQYSVGHDVISADRDYQRLRASGILDAHRLLELEGVVAVWASAELPGPLRNDETFRVAVKIAKAVFHPTRTWLGATPPPSIEAAYVHLERAVMVAAEGRPCTRLTDLLWLLLRPRGAGRSADEHGFPSLPFEPTAEVLGTHAGCIRSSAYPRAMNLHLTQFAGADYTYARSEVARHPEARTTYVCPEGHEFSSTFRRLSEAKDAGGCRYCANKEALAGFNSLADTHPDVARTWDHTANGDLTPQQVLAGSGRPVFWICPAGHSYRASPSSRTSARALSRGGAGGCGYCSNRIVAVGVNALSTTHPDVAATWHPTLNRPITEHQVAAGTPTKAWWVCVAGHDYEMAVSQRVSGRGCPYCSHRLVHPTTCLEVTHPDIASQWHPHLNGRLAPTDLVAGSPRKVWWLCAKGHSYETAVNSRTRLGTGCTYCANLAVDETNCMATLRPDLARELHPTRNGEHTPSALYAGTTKLLWWQCARGHEWQARGDQRFRQNTGCPSCRERGTRP